MPYAPPISDKPIPTRNHRRSRDSPIDQIPVFLSLPRVPRRRTPSNDDHDLPSPNDPEQAPPSPSLTEPLQPVAPTPRRALFSVKDDDSDSSDSSSDSDNDSVEEQQEVTQLVRRLAIKSPPSTPPPLKINSAIPFPTISSSRSPSPDQTIPPTHPPLVRTTSNPIVLANGKLLKSSLKSSSAPHLPDALHLRSRSVPSTPSGAPKNVHFKDEEDGVLESVRLFNKSGRPASLNQSAAEETETETEYESSSSVPGYPFPTIPDDTYVLAPPPETSPIPTGTVLPQDAHVVLESITVPNARPPTMRGTVLVRNITFGKSVGVRFTLDDWQTTSEVTANYVTSLPSLPPPFKTSTKTPPKDADGKPWDWASAVARAEWDRFSFTIKLEDVERKLPYSIMFVAVRFQAHGAGGGEWWDNNSGKNYRLSFLRGEPQRAKPFVKAASMFSAMSASPSFPPPTRIFSPSLNSIPSLTRPSTPARAHSNPTIPTYTTLGSIARKSKLSLSNYVAPTSPLDEATSKLVESQSQAPAISPADMGLEMGAPPVALIGGMPATAPVEELQWPSSQTSSPESAHPSLASSISTLNQLPTPIEAPSREGSPSSSAIFSPGAERTNETYAEFVKRWCFHQSPPPVSSSRKQTPRPPPSLNPWLDNYDGSRFPQGVTTSY